MGTLRYEKDSGAIYSRDEVLELRADPAAVVARHVPGFVGEYQRRGWALPETVDRVYDNARARAELGWQPRHDFVAAIACLFAGRDYRSELARTIGSKSDHQAQQTGG